MKANGTSPAQRTGDAPERGGIYYDRQEVRNHFEREQSLFHALPGLLHHALENAPFFATHLASIDPDLIIDREALASLPIMRRGLSMAREQAPGPFSGWAATPKNRLAKIYALPGRIYEPEGARVDYWRLARAMFAAEFKPGDLVLNSLPYHLSPMGAMAEGGARALGCPVVPAGDSSADVQAQVIADLEPAAYAGPALFLSKILKEARRQKLSTASLRTALIIGDGLEWGIREELAQDFGLTTFHAYATGDLGLIAYQTEAGEALVVDESVIVEIVDPANGASLPEGQEGEIVVTAFNPDYPLIRYATGARGAVVPGESPCGRTNMRIRLATLGPVVGAA